MGEKLTERFLEGLMLFLGLMILAIIVLLVVMEPIFVLAIAITLVVIYLLGLAAEKLRIFE